MLPLNESTIRSSFVNASRKEAKDAVLPDFLDAVAWDALDFLGWRDPKFAKRAYVVLPSLDGDPVGVVLRQADAAPRSRAMCSWCRDVRLPNDVAAARVQRIDELRLKVAGFADMLVTGR